MEEPGILERGLLDPIRVNPIDKRTSIQDTIGFVTAVGQETVTAVEGARGAH